MSEEMMELKVRVGDIDKSLGEVKTLMAMRESRSKDLHEKVDAIYDCLIGNGDATHPSVITRLDRVEQILSILKWVSVAVGGLLINAIFEKMKHG